MRINTLGSNQTEVVLNCGTVVFHSYSTPVAAMLASGTYVKTSTKYSNTTTRHINKWLSGINADIVEQSFLNNLL
jgi:hypothetical protein